MDAKKVRKLFYLFPSSFCCCWIRDGKTLDPGFGINIPDPQHGYNQTFLPVNQRNSELIEFDNTDGGGGGG
jgi:hypothetical protein